jgi:Resolvase, N terminal domain
VWTDYLTSAINTLKLPAKIIAGFFLFALLALIFDYFAIINLAELHPGARLIAILAALGFGSLSFAAFCAVLYDAFMHRHKRTLLAARREIRRAGAKTDRPALAKAIRRLEPGDVLVVTQLDRLARSTRDLLKDVYS